MPYSQQQAMCLPQHLPAYKMFQLIHVYYKTKLPFPPGHISAVSKRQNKV